MANNCDSAIDAVRNLLQDAARTRAWGEIQIHLKDGQVTVVRTTKQIKIGEDFSRDNVYNKHQQ